MFVQRSALFAVCCCFFFAMRGGGAAAAAVGSTDKEPWWSEFVSVACRQSEALPVPQTACSFKRDVFNADVLGLDGNWHDWCIVCNYNASTFAVGDADKLNQFFLWMTSIYAGKGEFAANAQAKNFTRLQVIVPDVAITNSNSWSISKLNGIVGAGFTTAELVYAFHGYGAPPDSDLLCTQSLLDTQVPPPPPICEGPFVSPLTPVSSGVRVNYKFDMAVIMTAMLAFWRLAKN